MQAFDIEVFDDREGAECALNFVRSALLFPKFGNGIEWPVELDMVPALIAAERAGGNEPDLDRVVRTLGAAKCPVEASFLSAVLDGSMLDREFLDGALQDLADHGSAGSGDRDDDLRRSLRDDPLALFAAALVADAVTAATATPEGGRVFVLQSSQMCADILQPLPERQSTPAPRLGR